MRHLEKAGNNFKPSFAAVASGALIVGGSIPFAVTANEGVTAWPGL